MILNRKLYTTDPAFKWHSSFLRIDKVQAHAKGLASGITIVEYIDPATIKSRKVDGRVMVDWTWAKTHLVEPGFASIGLHITTKARSRLKLAGTIRAAYRNSKKAPMLWYVVAGTVKDFEKRVLHEEGHGFEDLGTVDVTGLSKRNSENVLHYHTTGGDIVGFYRRVSFV